MLANIGLQYEFCSNPSILLICVIRTTLISESNTLMGFSLGSVGFDQGVGLKYILHGLLKVIDLLSYN